MGNCSRSKNAHICSIVTFEFGVSSKLTLFFLSFSHVFSSPAGVSWSYTEKHTDIWSLKGLGVGYKALRVVVCIVDIITTCLIQHSRRIFIYLYCINAYLSIVYQKVRCNQSTGQDGLGSAKDSRKGRRAMSSRDFILHGQAHSLEPLFEPGLDSILHGQAHSLETPFEAESCLCVQLGVQFCLQEPSLPH